MLNHFGESWLYIGGLELLSDGNVRFDMEIVIKHLEVRVKVNRKVCKSYAVCYKTLMLKTLWWFIAFL